VFRGHLAVTRFQLDDVSACCEVSAYELQVQGGCKRLDEVYLECPIRIPFFADGTRQLLQAPYHCYTGFFTKEAAI